MDLVVTVPAFLDLTAVGLEGLPALGEEKFAGDLVRSPGGGAITAIAAARLGLRTALVAPLGEDVPGRFVREELEGEGVSVGAATTARMPQTIVLPCGDDRAMVTVDPGARTRTSDLEPYLPAGAIACNLEQLHLVPEGTSMYLTCGSDDAHAYARRLPEEARSAGGLFVDGPDACLLAGADDAEAAGTALAASIRTVIVTRGAAPALAWHDGKPLPTTRLYTGQAVDTTGDVDLLCASYAWAELRGADPHSATEWARLHAALAMTVATATAGAVREDRLLEEGVKRGLVPPSNS
jgi:sugar/nucleoside kinase (ribokinase family)